MSEAAPNYPLLLSSFFPELVGLRLVHVCFANDNMGHLDFDAVLKKRTWRDEVFCDVYINCPVAISREKMFSCPYVLETTDEVRRDFEQQLHGLFVTAVTLDERDNSLHISLGKDYVVSVIPDEKNEDYGWWVLFCNTVFGNNHYVFWKNSVEFEEDLQPKNR